MAPVKVKSTDVTCKKCKIVVKNYVTCIDCGDNYHPTCLLRTGGVSVDVEGKIHCCSVAVADKCVCVEKDEEIDRLQRRISELNEKILNKTSFR